jgi:hypothetical protein
LKPRVHRAVFRVLCRARLLTLLLVTAAACAQSTSQRVAAPGELPDAPTPTAEPQTTAHDLSVAPKAQSAPARTAARGTSAHSLTARVKGVVSDIRGGLVPGAHIVIVCGEPAVTQETTADDVGFFSVGGLPAGTYSVTISSPGLETYELHDLHLRPGEVYSLPEVSLPMARTSADVTVTLTTEQLAEEELHNELKQRVLGILPNFYVSYQWNAAPLTARQKFKLTFRAATDPVFFGTTAITAGIEQTNNTFPEYGPGAAGYWRRYGAAYGDAVIGRFMGSVVFASAFHQDPRYFVMSNGPIPKRAWHAVSSTFIQRGDNRHWQPAYAHLLGNAVTGLIASTYHPGSSPGQLVLDNTILGLGGQAANNLIREFVLRHLAKNIPSYAKGKPPKE